MGNVRIETDSGQAVLVSPGGEIEPFGVGSSAAAVPIDLLRSSFRSALEVLTALSEELGAKFPDQEATVEVGLVVDGELNAKLVSVRSEATFKITMTIGPVNEQG